MPLDPELVDEVRTWLSKARSDLRAGRLVLDADPELLEHVVFNAQQAAEKALKAFLTFHEQVFGKTHNLGELGDPCARIDASLGPLLSRAGCLTEYAWKFRYPGEKLAPSTGEAADALRLAGEVFEAIIARLPEEVRP